MRYQKKRKGRRYFEECNSPDSAIRYISYGNKECYCSCTEYRTDVYAMKNRNKLRTCPWDISPLTGEGKTTVPFISFEPVMSTQRLDCYREKPSQTAPDLLAVR